MKLFAVRDMKAQIYLQPNFQRSVADALRSWETVVNQPDNMVSQFPNDFRLYHFGDFDTITGMVSILDTPSDLGSAADFKKRPTEVSQLSM